MTGYGLAEYKDQKYEITVEIRNLNNRFLDINLKLPKTLAAFELPLKDQIKKKIKRGKITVSVSFKDLSLTNGTFTVNEDNLNFYHNILRQIQKHTGMEESIKLEHFLQFKDLIEPDENIPLDPDCVQRISKVLDDALSQMNDMRTQEGTNIGRDIIQRLDDIELFLQNIEKLAAENPRSELERLRVRVDELLDGKEIDRDRLNTELAFLADKVDITEECTRLHSHIDLFRDVFGTSGEIGKKLNFILQEMQRESNTIGSKTSDIEISHQNIRIKEEIEKIREQVQNLE
jgi:uncharacterized protein (TIGR00255 family)